MLKNAVKRPMVLFLFICLVLFGIVACSAGNAGGAGSTPTPSSATPVPTTQTATPSPTSVPQSPLKIEKIDMSVNPTTIAGIACGTPMTVTYTATFHTVPNSSGGTVQFLYTVNNGRGDTPASITFNPGETTKAYTFTWSGALPLDHTFPEPGGIQVTSPNALISATVWPTGRCQIAQTAYWKAVLSPGAGAFNSLNGVAAVSVHEVWAVGTSSGSPTRTLIEYWNGRSWQIISSPSPGATDNSLNGVAAVSAADIWAVGLSQNSSRSSQTLIEHWSGTTWQVVSSPNGGMDYNQLDSVAAVSSTDIWAVGYSRNSNNASQALIEHWNGTAWQIISSPNMSDSLLSGVAIVSSTDIWAVGLSQNSNNVSQALIEHWNGTTWQIVSSPNLGTVPNALRGVAAISADNIWAVGSYGAPSNPPTRTLIEHWNGASWQVVSSPNGGTGHAQLIAVAAVSATSIWAVGNETSSSGAGQTLIEYWNGATWQIAPSPNIGTGDNGLSSVAAVSSTYLWAVGSFAKNGSGQTLTEWYS